MGLSNYSASKLLDHQFKIGAYTQPTNLKVGLSTADPLADNSALAEPSGQGYARVTNNSWTRTGSRTISNTGTVTFPQVDSGGNWGTITHFVVMDDEGTPNQIARGIIATAVVPFVADAGTDFLFARGHTFVNGDQVRLGAVTYSTGLSGNVAYYVIGVSGDTFQVSLTSGGAAVLFTTDSSGYVGKNGSKPFTSLDTAIFPAGTLTVILDA